MPVTNSRIVGSGFTSFQYSGKSIAFLDEIHDSGQAPIRQYEAVTPLGDYYPREFALPRVKSEGQLQFIIRELWYSPVWWQLALLNNTYNIIDVYNAQASTAAPITASTIIRKPPGTASNANRGWTYHNVNMITIDDREVVQIGALTMPRTLTAVYSTKNYFPAGSTASVSAVSGTLGTPNQSITPNFGGQFAQTQAT
jgi:hypothetical protein